jgi:hypothetical protein
MPAMWQMYIVEWHASEAWAARLQHAVRGKGVGNYDAASRIDDPNALQQ